jgi:hypothetical protein
LAIELVLQNIFEWFFLRLVANGTLCTVVLGTKILVSINLFFSIYLVLRPSLVLENILNYLNNTKNSSWHHACSLQSENMLSVFAYLTHILHSCFLLMCMPCCFVLMVVKLVCRLCWVQRVPLWRVHQLLFSPRQVSPYSLSY